MENYFASKYDYTPATELYSYDATAGDIYDYEVFGIGRINSNSHIISQGSGIILIDNPTSLDNGDYMLIGHDGAGISTWTTSNLPPAYTGVERLERTWKVDKTNEIGNIRIAIDTADLPVRPAGYDNFILFVDDDDNPANGIESAQVLSERFGSFVRINSQSLGDGYTFFIGVGRNISVQDGNWNDPATWLLNVPAIDEEVTVSHNVNLTANTQVGGVLISSASGLINLGSNTLGITTTTIDTLSGGNINAGTGTIIYSASASQCIESLVYYNLVVSGSATKTLCGDIVVTNDLTILNTTTVLDVDPGNNYSITLNGDWQSNGTFNAHNGSVLFDGSAAQNINRNTGDLETFYDLEIGPNSLILTDHNIVVRDTLLMNGGNFILNSGKTLTIGESTANRGALIANSGFVVGKLVYWIAGIADDNRDIIFPIGTNTHYRPFIINANNFATNGRLQLQFIQSDPLDLGLPLNDGLFVVDETFTEGYWQMFFAGGLTINAAAGMDIDVRANGFGSLPLTANSRLLSRYSTGSGWLLNGTHQAVATNVVGRNGMTLMTYEYAVGHVVECTPIFTSCPTDITQDNDAGDCGAIVSWTAPAPEAICTTLNVTSSHNPGDFFTTGTTEVSYYLWNGALAVDSCKFFVTVNDIENPTANCKNITVVLDATGNASIVATDIDNGSIDNCAINTYSVDISSFTCADIGIVPVTLTVIDNSGNSSQCIANVNVTTSLNINSATVQSCNAIPGIAAVFEADVVGGDGNYSYFWDGLNDAVDPFMQITLFPPSISTSNTSTEETPLLSWFLPDGNYNIRLVVTDGNGCVDTLVFNFNKNGLTTDNVSVNYTDECEGSTLTYTRGYDVDATYDWLIENGTILSAITDTNEIDVMWDLGIVQGVLTTTITQPSVLGDCESSVIDTVTIHSLPIPSFVAPVNQTCLNATHTYTLSSTYSSYNWTITGGNLLAGGGPSNSFATVQWTSAGAGNVDVSVSTTWGCSNSVDIDVDVHEVVGSIDSQNNESCPGAADGDVTVSATGGLGLHQVSIDGGSNWFNSPHTFVGLTSNNYTVIARDALGCTDNVPVTITVADVIPPAAICQDITVYLDGTGNVTISSADVDNGSNDACGIASMVIDISTFDCSDIGPNNVTLTVTDNSSNIASCVAVVTVADTISPTMSDPAPVNIECAASIPAAFANYAAYAGAGNSAFDNCGINQATFTHLGDVSDGGSCPELITRTYYIEDNEGNSTTCTQFITVSDVTSPTASNPGPLSVECVGDVPAADISVVTDEADNCAGPLTVTYVSDVSDGNTCPEVITRTYRVSDDCGNFLDVYQTITVLDVTIPALTAPLPISVECSADVPAAYANYTQWTAAGGSASDNCSVNTGSFTFVLQVSDGNSCPETLTRTYQIEDACGNIGQVTQDIVVNDVTPPVLTSPAPVSAECNASIPAPFVGRLAFELGGGTVTDNCGIDDASFTWIGDSSDGNTCPEVITRTYEISDLCGNATQITQTITVNDITAPTASNPLPVAVECIGDVPASDVTVVTDEADNCTAAPTVTFVSDASDGNTCPEVITRTYRVSDDCGNFTDVFQTITVNDISAPTASNPLPVAVECIGDVPASDVTVVTDEADNCTAAPTVTFVSDASDGNTCPEVITRTYRVSDDCGNFTDVFQTITVNDISAPTASNPLPVAVECIGDVPASDVTVVTDEADNCTAAPTVTFVSDASDGNTCPEVITRTYRVSDDCGNFTDVFQTITVNDITAPTASNPLPVAVECIGDVPASDVTVVTDEADNCTAAPTVTFVSDASDGNTCPEVITRTYRVSDDCGNFTDVFQTITVNDITAPTASNPLPVAVECIGDVPASDVTVVTDEADNCTAAPTVTFVSDASDGNTCPEVITRTYRISDDCGNFTDVFQTITVNDITAPTASNPLPVAVECIGDVPASDVTVVTDEADNCTAAPTVTFVSDASDGNTCPEVITRTYRVSDDCGNFTDVFQTITINDVTNPVLTSPGDLSYECIGDVPAAYGSYAAWTASGGTATDNCGLNTTSFTFVLQVSDGNSCPETLTRTYQIEDACGNIGQVTQDIVVNDVTPPVLTSPAPLSAECSSGIPAPYVGRLAFELGGGTVTDNCGIDDASFTWIGDSSDGNTCPEVITRTYEISDLCGNATQITQTITVNDISAPTASNPLPVAVECIGDVPASDVTVVTDEADNCTAAPTVSFVSDASDGNTCPEVITRTYRVSDDCGNFTDVFQTITVNDITAPTASNPLAVAVECIGDVPASDVTVVTDEADNCTAAPTVTFVSDASDGNTCPEVITRTYRISDDCGNFTDVFQTITVNDISAPTASNPLPVAVECIGDVPAGDVTGVTDEADNCTAAPTVTL